MSSEKHEAFTPTPIYRLVMVAQAVAIIAVLPFMLEGLSFLAKQLGLPRAFSSAQAVTLVAIICLVILLRSGVSLRQIGFKRLRLNVRNIALILGGTLLILLLDPLLKHVFAPLMGFEFEDYTTAYVARFKDNLGLYIGYMVFIVFFSAGIGEEILTRGFLFNRFERAFAGVPASWCIALFLQAIAFGCFHYSAGVQAVFVTAVSGVILGSIYLLTDRNLFAAIATHILVNTIYITSFYFGRGVFV